MTINVGGAEQALIETQDKRIEELEAQVAALTTDLAMQIAALKDASKALTERQAKVAALEAENTRLGAVLDRLVEILDVVPDFTSPEFMQRRILEAIKCARNKGESDEQTT